MWTQGIVSALTTFISVKGRGVRPDGLWRLLADVRNHRRTTSNTEVGLITFARRRRWRDRVHAERADHQSRFSVLR